jgi:hypothetical protein
MPIGSPKLDKLTVPLGLLVGTQGAEIPGEIFG